MPHTRGIEALEQRRQARQQWLPAARKQGNYRSDELGMDRPDTIKADILKEIWSELPKNMGQRVGNDEDAAWQRQATERVDSLESLLHQLIHTLWQAMGWQSANVLLQELTDAWPNQAMPPTGMRAEAADFVPERTSATVPVPTASFIGHASAAMPMTSATTCPAQASSAARGESHLSAGSRKPLAVVPRSGGTTSKSSVSTAACSGAAVASSSGTTSRSSRSTESSPAPVPTQQTSATSSLQAAGLQQTTAAGGRPATAAAAAASTAEEARQRGNELLQRGRLEEAVAAYTEGVERAGDVVELRIPLLSSRSLALLKTRAMLRGAGGCRVRA